MTVLPSPLVLAAGSVQHAELAVLVVLYGSLDTDDYRKPPVFTVAHRLRLSERHVYRAIRQLARMGYLERGPRLGNALTFRLANPERLAA